MHLAIGDVVRDLEDMSLGSVVGIADDPSAARYLVLQLSGGELRRAWPHSVELVGRASNVLTTNQFVSMLVCMGLGLSAALCGYAVEQGSGGGLPASILTGLGLYSAVMTTFRLILRLTGPRRIRV
jgi:hypothetical protein